MRRRRLIAGINSHLEQYGASRQMSERLADLEQGRISRTPTGQPAQPSIVVRGRRGGLVGAARRALSRAADHSGGPDR